MYFRPDELTPEEVAKRRKWIERVAAAVEEIGERNGWGLEVTSGGSEGTLSRYYELTERTNRRRRLRIRISDHYSHGLTYDGNGRRTGVDFNFYDEASLDEKLLKLESGIAPKRKGRRTV